MQTAELRNVRHEAATLARGAILAAVEQNQPITAAADAQVQRAIHLLRSTRTDAETLSRLEGISCALMRMHHARRDGRVNAYASTLLRVRKAAEAL